MIKCPNCGSSAQVKLMFADDLNEEHYAEANYVHQYYTCGCGCGFQVTWMKEGVFKSW